MKPLIAALCCVVLGFCGGCENLTVSSHPPSPLDILDRDAKTPRGWVKHDARECKFSFGQDVVITDGFYRGRTGAVMELREDGYVIDVFGYRGIKPSGQMVDRSPVVYGVPESHLELDEKKDSVP